MPNLDQAVNDYVTATKAQTASGLDTTPDDATRTVQLEKATGVPSQVIAPNLDQFEKSTQRDMAIQLVSQDPELQTYVHSHPMAASVSSDDWGALSEFSRAAGQTAQTLKALNAPWDQALSAGVAGAVSGFRSGFGNDPLISTQSIARDFPALDPNRGPLSAVSNLLTVGGLGSVELAGRVGSGIFSALTVGAGEAVRAGAESVGMDKMNAARLGRDIQAMSEYHMIDPGGAFVAGHELPPAGVHPGMDKLKAELNKSALDSLDEDVKNAQASATHERSPEMFQRLAEQHYGNQTFGIHADAALNLYGDKPPSPDDGLLGWVPGIADKLDTAKHTGADVEVPVADWVSRVDPAVAKLLRDDLRLWPDGITAREAGDAKVPEGEAKVDKEDVQYPSLEYPAMVDSTLAQVRGAYGLEPMFAMGDRKLSLISASKEAYGDGTESHFLNILDENGKVVGQMEVIPRKDGILQIEMINGIAGLWANSFGPSLIRDLKRQLKELYPDHTDLAGYRVSGARKEAGNLGMAVVKLDTEAPAGWGSIEGTRNILADAYLREIAGGVQASIAPTELFTSQQKAVAGAIHDEIAKMTGGKAKVVPTAGMKNHNQRILGAHWPRSGMIMYDLMGPDPVGVGRHETIHYLRDQGLFSDKEWATLKEAAMQENWLDRYNINTRYKGLHAEGKYEEAVAEGFREWVQQKAEYRREYSPVAQIFSKLWDFLQNIKGRINEIFGRVPDKNELFTKISQGQIADRAALGSADGGVKFAKEDLDNLRADSLGLDRKAFANIQKLVQERYRQDVEASFKQAETQQARRQTQEWKSNKEAMATEVEQTIRQRPDVATDLFLGSGELRGEKIQQRFTLRSGDLTPEQRALLPDHYVSKNGIPVDYVANLFGYTSGDAMVEHLGAYQLIKGDRTPQAALKHVVDVETDRQMEMKYGNLAENVLSEAKDQALSKNDLNILTEEYHAAALQAGVTAIDKNTILAKATDIVSKTPLNEVDFNKQLALVGRHYRDAVRALVNGDPASAVIALERRTLAAHVASEMKKVEKEKGKFDRVAKYYAKAWDPTKAAVVEPNFSLFTRDILSRLGLRNGMSVPGLAKAIADSGFADLADFVTKTEDASANKISGLELPVPDWIMGLQRGERPLDKLSVAEFREARDAVTMMDKVGRADQKIIRQGEAADRKEWVDQAVGQLASKFPPLPSKEPKGLRRTVNSLIASLTSNETLMSRFDGRDPHGIFTETITKPAAEAANREARLNREIAQAYRALGEIKDAKRTLDSPFIDPRNGKPVEFNRRNLAAVISNIGNEYNLSILAKGWKIDKTDLMNWIEAVSLPDEIERAQKLGDIFKGLKVESDREYQALYGIAPENVVPRPFTMHGKQYEGWYHPIIGDPQLSRFVNKMPDVEVEHNFWPSTSNAYTKRRTGAVQVVDLTYDSVPAKLQQVMHDISFRAVVSNIARIFKDDRFRDGVRSYYGKTYMGTMDSWLQSVAGDASYSSDLMREATRASNYLRQNVISTQIAFNLGTVEKHGLTAGLMSTRELGANPLKSGPEFAKVFAEVAPALFKRSVNDMFGKSIFLGTELFDFVKRNSEEIQRRDRNYLDTMQGAQAQFEGDKNWRGWIAQTGAKMVAFSDMLSAAPMWLAKYRSEMEANGGVHGDAVREADMAVRRAHGSTAITNLPSIARGSGPVTPWLTSLYGFMGTSMQRRIEIFHDINDVYKLGMDRQIKEAAKGIPAILSSVAVYYVWTGYVEELITGQFTDDHRGLGSKALTFLFGTVAQSVIGLRDLVYDLETGRESAGLISTPVNDFIHLERDVMKKNPLAKNHAGQAVQDGCAAIGDLFGLCPKHLGTLAHYGLDVFDGFQHPRTGSDIYRGAISGKQKLHVVK